MKVTTTAQAASIVIMSLVLCRTLAEAREPAHTTPSQRKPPLNGSMFGKRSVLAPIDGQPLGSTTESYVVAEIAPEKPTRRLTGLLVDRCIGQLRDPLRYLDENTNELACMIILTSLAPSRRAYYGPAQTDDPNKPLIWLM